METPDRVERRSAWQRVMDALSVPESYFWREIDQIQAMAHHVIPALLRSAQ